MKKNKTKMIAQGVSIISLLILMAGCGHNIATYVDGQEVSLAGIVVYRNGKVLQANIKENASVTLDAKAKNDTAPEQASNTESVVKFALTTGDQVTGYRVDMEKEKTKKGSENE